MLPQRATAIFVGLLIFFALVVGRLVQLQIVQADQWKRLAQSFQEGQVVSPQPRGYIYDRSGKILAHDLRAISIALDNYHMTRPDLLERLLSAHLQIPREAVRERLYRPGYFTWLARGVPPETAEHLKNALREAGIRGVLFLEDWKRAYPQKSLASNLIGFAGVDGQGLEGIELGFDELLRGEETIWSVVRRADGTEIRRQVVRQGRRGGDLYLTIDARIQQVAESALERGVRTYKAQAGFAVVLNPQTGEVLAMAQSETYDLNRFQQSHPQARKNLSVAYAFEPGSSFKVFTMLAALEAGVIGPTERVSGSATLQIAHHTFRNSEQRDYGMVTPAGVIKDSINTAMIRIAQRLGEEALYGYLRRFGFGQKTGIELPGEIAGYLAPVKDWSALEIGAIAIGQSVSVTAIQMATRVAAIANGGQLLKPRVVKAVRGRDGKLEPTKPEVLGRIASEESCRHLTEMMIETVRDGTGILAQIEGVAIAAKTGTAQKAVPGKGYVKGKFVASLVGFFPAEAPRYVVVVVLDEPGGREYYGGLTAAPIFKEIALGLLSLDRSR
ncbi:MAG: penicillin-binding protein 2 [Candidatus Bipolaricaulota bacterium]|nr:penicillin-binding protein 2 [Candidatus Bipolaricaulota bacterium]MCS7274853.1 penicillin-binding protein 2 [Candidatus Bipolaricaulota bacterium]MDW8111274.1 penicillin-binding protein 2 [Candidatus Bipolaricaulota bacterium]MDW8328590.1 penicillin-binding protein 2 [Candidatus Bipolaricaulota bacterium]